MESVVAIVVLYNPNPMIADIYAQIAPQVDKIVYIDNSDKDNNFVEQLRSKEKVLYYSMNGNQGLSLALRKGCEIGINQGYRYALLLDQDTELSETLVKDLLSCFYDFNDDNCNRTGLVAPNIKNFYYKMGKRILDDKPWYPDTICETSFAITSGSLIDLTIYKNLGGFDDKLFIMLIDQDYCCNLQSHNFKIIRNGTAYIYQEFGCTTQHKFFGKTVKDPNYPPLRYYYLFRNERYCRLKWKEKYLSQKVNLFKTYMIILIYGKEKIAKTRQCVLGWFEGKKLWRRNQRY